MRATKPTRCSKPIARRSEWHDTDAAGGTIIRDNFHQRVSKGLRALPLRAWLGVVALGIALQCLDLLGPRFGSGFATAILATGLLGSAILVAAFVRITSGVALGSDLRALMTSASAQAALMAPTFVGGFGALAVASSGAGPATPIWLLLFLLLALSPIMAAPFLFPWLAALALGQSLSLRDAIVGSRGIRLSTLVYIIVAAAPSRMIDRVLYSAHGGFELYAAILLSGVAFAFRTAMLAATARAALGHVNDGRDAAR